MLSFVWHNNITFDFADSTYGQLNCLTQYILQTLRLDILIISIQFNFGATDSGTKYSIFNYLNVSI